MWRLLFSIFLSFTDWNFLSGFEGIKWVGLSNFSDLLEDRTFIQAVGNTFIYTIATVPVSILIALILAYLLNEKVYLKTPLRLCFFIPYISSAVALAAVFKVLFRENGPINMFCQHVLQMETPPAWFADSSLNKIPIIIFVKFTRITFPLISPTTFYLVIVRLIATFKLFTAVNIMTFGTPARANTTIVTRVYEEAFNNYKFGYASAEAWVLVAIILIITLINFWGQKKWVHY